MDDYLQYLLTLVQPYGAGVLGVGGSAVTPAHART